MNQTLETLVEKQWDLYSLKKPHLFLLSSLPQGPQTQCFCRKSKAERETWISYVKFGEMKKKLRSIITSYFLYKLLL